MENEEAEKEINNFENCNLYIDGKYVGFNVHDSEKVEFKHINNNQKKTSKLIIYFIGFLLVTISLVIGLYLA